MNYFSHGHACSTVFVPCNICSEQEKAKKKFIPTFNKKLRVCVIHSCALYRCARYTQINAVHPSSGSGQFIALARSPKLSYSYGYLVRTVMKSGTLKIPQQLLSLPRNLSNSCKYKVFNSSIYNLFSLV